MSDPQSNYLKNTIPELEDQFIEVIGKVPLFAQLPHELRKQLFQYSKFVKLEPRERVIEQGMFDQEIFVLLQGKLNVLLIDGAGKESLIDVMEQPFTLFGERSLLGEQRGATIQADSEAFLLGIDLSSLPDILDGVDSAENRQDDDAYLQNITMYTVFSTVLTQRMERLVRDQYKLKQKVRVFQKRQSSWTQEWMLARVFNQFCSDELPLHSEVREIIHRKIKDYHVSNPSLLKLILARKISTQRFYMEMVRLNTLGDLDCMHDLMLDLISELSTSLRNHQDYSGLFEINLWEIYDIPQMTTLADFLNTLYQTVIDSKILKKPLSKEEFLDANFSHAHLSPPNFVQFLQKGGWVEDNFSLAYIIYLLCQQCIYAISQANQKIKDYVHFLSTYNAPKQASQLMDRKEDSLIQELYEMQEKQSDFLAQNAPPPEPSAQDAAEDLLSSLGL